MEAISPLRRVSAAGIVISLALAGCALVSPAKPVAVITAPPSGTQVDANTELQVQVNATDQQGIVRIDLLVNNAVVTSQSSPTPGGEPTFSAVLRWTPTNPGQQVVEVLAYNVKGDVSVPTAVNIVVRQPVASITATPTATPTATSTGSATAVPSPSTTALASNSDNTSPTATPQPGVTVIIQQPPQPSQPQPPSKPSNFKPVGSGTTITFNWTDNSSNELGFRIYQVGTTAPVLDNIPTHNGTGPTSYAWTGRPCNFSGDYFVRAFNNQGESASSNSDTAVTIPCIPTNMGLSAHSPNSLQFTWSVASPHNEAGFRLYEQSNPTPVATRGPNLGSGGTVLALSNLPCDIQTSYSVRAFNSAGETGDSNSVPAVTAPCPPEILQLYGIEKTGFVFNWQANSTNEVGFHVYKDDVLLLTVAAPVLFGKTRHYTNDIYATHVDQPCGTMHVYNVRGYNAAGESLSSGHLPASTLAC